MGRILMLIFAVSLLSISTVFAQNDETSTPDVIGVAYNENTQNLELLVENPSSDDSERFTASVTVKPATSVEEVIGSADFGVLKAGMVTVVPVDFGDDANPLSEETVYNVAVNYPTEENPAEFVLYRNLTATQIEFDTSTKYFVGSEVALDITIQNKDTEIAYPHNDYELYYRVDFQFVPDIEGANNQTAELAWSIIEPLNIEIGAGKSETITLTTSDINRGEYNRYVVQFGEKETLEQGQSHISTVVDNIPSTNLIINSNLPPELEELIAAIALFAGMMLVMAVATEIVVDTLRLAVGLKRKTSAMEAITNLQNNLPGTLAELGVTAEKRIALRNLTNAVKDEIVANTEKVDQAINFLRSEQSFKDILDKLVDWGAIEAGGLKISFDNQGIIQVTKTGAQQIEEDKVVEEIKKFFNNLKQKVTEVREATTEKFLVATSRIVTPEHKDAFEKDVADLIDKHFVAPLHQKSIDLSSEAGDWTSKNIESKLKQWLSKTSHDLRQNFEQLVRELAKFIQEETIQRLSEWLKNQADENADTLKTEFEKLLDGDLGEKLDHIGIDKEQRDDMADHIRDIAREASIEGIRKVVEEVQKRREDIQSTIVSLLQFPMLDLKNFNENGKTHETRRDRFYFDGIHNSWQDLAFWIALLVSLIIVPLWMARTFVSFKKPLPLLGEQLDALLNFPEILVAIVPMLVVAIVMIRALSSPSKLRGTREIPLFKDTTGKDMKANNANPVKDWVHAFLAFALQFVIGGVVLYFVMLVHTDLEQQIPDNSGRIWDIVITLAIMIGINFVIYNQINRSRAFTSEIKTMDAITAPAHIAKIEDVHQEEEAARIRAIRLISAVVGVGLATVMKIDSADLLREAIPAFASTLDTTQLPLLHVYGITPGILLTGLAASAGSTFWHDVLDRLQTAKAESEKAAKVLRDAGESIDTIIK